MTIRRVLRPAAHALALVGLVAGFTALPTARAAAQDVIQLTNGDHLTGQLLHVRDGVWTLKYAGGEVKLSADDIASFTSGGDVGIRLADGTITAGRVTVAGGEMRFMQTDGTSRVITAGDIAALGSATDLAALREVHVGFLSPIGRFWSANIGAGFANSAGNSRSRGANGDLKVQRATSKDRLAFGFGAAAQWAPNDAGDLVQVVKQYYGSGRLDVFVSKAVFLFAGTLQEIDTFQGIDLRSNYDAGLGYQVLSGSPTDLRFNLAGGLRVENFTPAAGDTTTSTPIWSAGSQLKQKLGPFALDWSVRWTPAVDDLKNYRLLSDAGLSTTILKGLGFRIGSRNQYNNTPPAGIKKHDWLFTTNLTYALGG